MKNVNDFIKKNADKMTDQKMALELSKKGIRNARGGQLTRSAVAVRRQRMGIPAYVHQQEISVEHEVETHTLKTKKQVADKKNRELVERVAELEKALAVSNDLKSLNYKPKPIVCKSKSNSESVAFIVISDTHLEERVLKSEVNGLNEYNLEVSAQRMRNLFTRGHKLIKRAQHGDTLDTVVIALLGDIITNRIHDELAETNLLGPSEAVVFAYQLLVDGIEHLASDKTIKKIVVRCHTGNHGRTTPEHRHGQNEAETSLEFILYTFLANHFKGTKVEVEVPKSALSYMTVLGTEIRFMHGHAIRFGGGIGGPTIPINKALARWDIGKQADLTLLGHFHQFFDGGRFLINGSLIGTTAYSLSFGHEPPRQAFFLVTHAYGKPRGKNTVCPIWVD